MKMIRWDSDAMDEAIRNLSRVHSEMSATCRDVARRRNSLSDLPGMQKSKTLVRALENLQKEISRMQKELDRIESLRSAMIKARAIMDDAERSNAVRSRMAAEGIEQFIKEPRFYSVIYENHPIYAVLKDAAAKLPPREAHTIWQNGSEFTRTTLGIQRVGIRDGIWHMTAGDVLLTPDWLKGK